MAEENDIKEELKTEGLSPSESNIQPSEIVRFTVFSIFYVVILLNQINTENAYNISAGITQALSSCDTSSITNAADVESWLSSNFLPLMFERNVYFS